MNSEHPSTSATAPAGRASRAPARLRVARTASLVLAVAMASLPAAAVRAEPRGGAKPEPAARPASRGEPTRPATRGEQGASDAAYRDLVDQALGEFKRKNWPEARSLFAQAHAINPNARTLRGLGVVSFEMREYVSAIVYLEQAIEEARQALTDTQRGECQGLLTRARTYVGGFTPILSPADATLVVDGAPPVRDAGGSLLLAFGEHVLSLSAPGYQTSTRRLQVQGGERTELHMELAPEAPPVVVAAPAPPAAAPDTAAGAVELAPAAAAPKQPVARTETVTTGGLKYTWVALGAGVLFGGLSGGAYYAGKHEYDKLLDACDTRGAAGDPCSPGDPDTDKVRRYERLTNAGLGLAAVSAVGAAVLLAIEWPRERQVVVGVGPQSITLRGAF
jgi:tetratricopeptide (TPR) repeat protein